MAELSPQQIKFLESQGIPLSKVFDASGLSRPMYQERMKALGMVVAVGVTPCGAAGHTLRSRAGHCVQCGTHNLAFLRRFDDAGVVYVATSASLSLTKVGTSTDLASRLRNLCSYGYGGAHDWKVNYSESCAKAGRVEFEAHRQLCATQTSRSYVKDGARVNCQELFTCSADQAINAVKTSIRAVATY